MRIFSMGLCVWASVVSVHLQAEEYRFADLKSLVEVKQVVSVDELLPQLPESLKSRYLLASDSHSAQFGSSDYPRIILFSSSARFIMAVTGSSTRLGSTEVEVIQYNEALQDFDFFNISFTERGPIFRDGTLIAKPETCKTCHAKPTAPDDLNPIWNPYNIWPNFYGAMDDVIDSTSAEGRNFKRFIETQAASGRYAHLKGLPTVDDLKSDTEWYISTQPEYYSQINSDSWVRMYSRQGAYSFYARANYKFTQEIGHLVTRKVAAKLVKDSEFNEMKFLIDWAFNLNQEKLPEDLECKTGIQTTDFEARLTRERYLMKNFRLGLVEKTLANQNPPSVPFKTIKKEYLEKDEIRTSDRIYDSLRFHFSDHRVLSRLQFAYSCFDKKFPVESLVTTDPSIIGRSFSYGNSGLKRFLKEAIHYFEEY